MTEAKAHSRLITSIREVNNLTGRVIEARRSIARKLQGAKPGRLKRRFRQLLRYRHDVKVVVVVRDGDRDIQETQIQRLSTLGYAGHLTQKLYEAAARFDKLSQGQQS